MCEHAERGSDTQTLLSPVRRDGAWGPQAAPSAVARARASIARLNMSVLPVEHPERPELHVVAVVREDGPFGPGHRGPEARRGPYRDLAHHGGRRPAGQG